MPIEAKLLLGWMNQELALQFLTNERVPPLAEHEARDLWELYRGRVDALPAEHPSEPQPLTSSERETRRIFLRHCHQQQKQDVEDVIKLDLATLPIRQFRIVVPRLEDYQAVMRTRAGWTSRALPTGVQEPTLQVHYSQAGTTTESWFELPHGEFLFPFNPTIGGFQVRQADRWVEAMRVDQRYLLWAGYHRSLARLVNTIGDGIERSALMALTRNRLLDTPNQSVEDTHCRALCLRARPALLKDFLDAGLCITLTLKKQRFLYHVKGEVLAAEDAS